MLHHFMVLLQIIIPKRRKENMKKLKGKGNKEERNDGRKTDIDVEAKIHLP